MNLVDKLLRGTTQFLRDSVGIDTDKNTEALSSIGSAAKSALSNIDLQPLKQGFNKLTSTQSLAKTGQDFRRQAVNSIKPQALSILAGALVGGTAATVYNINKDLRAKKKRVQDPPQVRYTTKLSRVYGGMSLGVLTALLINKYLMR